MQELHQGQNTKEEHDREREANDVLQLDRRVRVALQRADAVRVTTLLVVRADVLDETEDLVSNGRLEVDRDSRLYEALKFHVHHPVQVALRQFLSKYLETTGHTLQTLALASYPERIKTDQKQY